MSLKDRQIDGKPLRTHPLSDAELQGFRKDMLHAHNKLRQKCQCSTMQLNEELNRMAQAWAEHLGAVGHLEHSDEKHRQLANEQYVGENVFNKMVAHHTMVAAETFIIPGRDVVHDWFDEKQFYNPYQPGFQAKTSNFTQMMWDSSTELGIGICRQLVGRRSVFFVVANYSPGGNNGIAMDYDLNVPLLHALPDKSYRDAFDPVKKPIYPCPLSDAQQNTFREEVLLSHNKYRSMHKASAVSLLDSLTSMAQSWCERLAENNTMEHSPEELRFQDGFEYIGENLFHFTLPCTSVDIAQSSMISGQTVVQYWYEEMSSYDFTQHSFQQAEGHFSQIVWRETRHIGVGVQRRLQGRRAIFFVVVMYGPGGNYGDFEQYEVNVRPCAIAN